MPNTSEENQQAKDAFGLIFSKYGQWIAPDKLAYFHAADPNTVYFYMNAAAFTLEYGTRAPVGCQINGFTRRVAGQPPKIYINREVAAPSTMVHEMLHYFTHPNFVQVTRVNADLVEAITEYFTRKLVKVAQERFVAASNLMDALDQQGEAALKAFHDDPRMPRMVTDTRMGVFAATPRRSYEAEHATLQNLRGLAKAHDPAWQTAGSRTLQPRPGAPPQMPGPAGAVQPPAKPGTIKRAYFQGELAAINLLDSYWRMANG